MSTILRESIYIYIYIYDVRPGEKPEGAICSYSYTLFLISDIRQGMYITKTAIAWHWVVCTQRQPPRIGGPTRLSHALITPGIGIGADARASAIADENA